MNRAICRMTIIGILVMVGNLKPIMGEVIRIPTDYSTFREGMAAADHGDTVMIAYGIYRGDNNKNLNMNGKAIVVTAEHFVGDCIIDCEGSGREFIFNSMKIAIPYSGSSRS